VIVSVKTKKEKSWINLGLTNTWVLEDGRWHYDHQDEERPIP
jgi:uncharacterized protein YdaU (DUF1376 family)